MDKGELLETNSALTYLVKRNLAESKSEERDDPLWVAVLTRSLLRIIWRKGRRRRGADYMRVRKTD
jgi:hypothetical protein